MENIIGRSNEFVVIDIETSHFHPNKGAMIIELAAVKIMDDKIVDKRGQLINPERTITAKITEITGITNEMLVGKPTFKEILPKFYNFIENATIVAHNAQFDWDRFLVYFFKKVGIYPKNNVIDTLKLSRKYLKNLESHKLGDLCNHLGIELNNAHRALADAEATAKLFLHLKNDLMKNVNLDQVSMLANGSEKIIPQNVRKVAYWEKQVSKKQLLQRLYVTLDRSVVFLDIPTKSWEVKSSNEPIDFESVEKGVIKMMNVPNLEDIIKRYA